MQLALIGVGLIGGSAAWAMKNAGVFTSVRAFDLNERNARKAVEIGAADSVAASIKDAVKEADAVLVAVPVLAMEKVFAEVGRHMSEQTFVTDVGSVRSSVIDAARRGLAEKFSNYAPVHPIAGGEMPGIDYAEPGLFKGAKAISTPQDGMNQTAVRFWEEAWKKVGCEVINMTPSEHDRIYAEVSHVPHILSYVMVLSLLHDYDSNERLKFAGAGFRDFTRIAASDPRMWTDICVANKDAVLKTLENFKADLETVCSLIEKADKDALEDTFTKASSARRSLFVRKPLH